MNEIAIIFLFCLIGAFLHYFKKALDADLWRGDTEPNPFRFAILVGLVVLGY